MENIRFVSSADALAFIADNEIATVDLKFVDLVGRWHHVTLPGSYVSEKTFEHGIGFDASQYAGYKKIESGDLNLRPDPTTGRYDPFWEQPTLTFICDLIESDTGERFVHDPRYICQRAEALFKERLRAGGYRGDLLISPEFEFHIFDRVYYKDDGGTCLFIVNPPETNDDSPVSGAVAPEGFHISGTTGYHSIQPLDEYADVRSEMVRLMELTGIRVKYHHHEVGQTGQCEIETLFATMTRAADDVLWTKYIVRNLAAEYGLRATFMPKPIFGEAGNGMHVHIYVGGDGFSDFWDAKHPTNFSSLGRHFLGGVLQHGRSLAAFSNPSTNSYKRFISGYEAPVSLFYSVGNRVACARIPKYAINEREMRFEFRSGDATANPYLMFAAVIMAGLDGIENETEPGEPINKNIADLTKRERNRIKKLPSDLEEALAALENDCEYLLRGDIIDNTLINNWTKIKRHNEIERLQYRPHPYEYNMYFDL